MTTATDTEVVRAALDAYNAGESGDALCDGIRRWLHDVDERFDDARLEAGEINQIDFKVLTLGRFVLGSGEEEGTRDFGLVCEVYDGRVLRWSGYTSHIEAIRAAEMAEC